eukprot:COSAG06_NODE_1004_length_11128_cov_5.572944_10_plen_78_part_00
MPRARAAPHQRHTSACIHVFRCLVRSPFVWQDSRGSFHALFHKFTDEHPNCGPEHAFLEPFYTKNDQFTKTGSGQTR